MTARISVIIPVYRGADIIGHAISSALSQTVPCQVVVIDDASGDDTVAAAHLAAQGSPRVRILEQPTNRGPSAARNRAIAAADAEFVALLDADDRMAPGRLEALLNLADQRGWDFVADDQIRVSDWSNTAAGTRLWSDNDFGEIELTLARFVRENLMAYSGQGRELGYIKPIMRREALLQHNLFYNEDMRLGEDFDLYARAIAAGLRFGLVDPQGYLAFNSPGSLSRSHSSADLKALWQSSRSLYRRSDVPAEAKDMLKEHVLLSHKKWAWVRLIEAKHSRKPLEALGAFMAPPPVIADLVSRLGGHFRGASESRSVEHQEMA